METETKKPIQRFPRLTIQGIQSEVETALQLLPELVTQLPEGLKPLLRLAPPKGSRAQVSLRRAKTKRQVKRNAPAQNWSPESGLVSISYDMSPAGEVDAMASPAADTAPPEATPQTAPAEDPARDLVLALAKAEQDPQLGFVSLKWFRDAYLPQQSHTWAVPPENRQRVLVEAISRKLILTSKVPNPKNPQFPVTAIRINRPLAEVRSILNQEQGFGSAFSPIRIQGERLSETVLHERR